MHTLSLSHTPDLLALAAAEPAHFPCLLQSAGSQGWDILAAFPEDVRVYGAGQAAELAADLAALPVGDGWATGELPFRGGWFFYLGYELLEQFEPSVPVGLEDDFPLGALLRVPAAILVNRADASAWLVAEHREQLDRLIASLAEAPAFNPRAPQVARVQEDPPQAFTDAVRRIQRYIREGDVFQVNVSRQWDVTLAQALSPAEVFAALRLANPAPFSALLQLGEHAVVSSSPERLVRVVDGWADASWVGLAC